MLNTSCQNFDQGIRFLQSYTGHDSVAVIYRRRKTSIAIKSVIIDSGPGSSRPCAKASISLDARRRVGTK